jgi:delta8-fatty-acid desaturase
MNKYVIGRVQKPWENRIPPIQGGSPKSKAQDINDNTEKSSVSKKANRSSSGMVKIKIPSSSYIASQTKEQIDLDLTKYPSLDSGVQNEIAKKYRALEDRVRREGLYNCHYNDYFFDALRCSILFSVMLLFLHWGQYILSAISLGCFWHQLVFTVHDAAHMGITHNYHIDSVQCPRTRPRYRAPPLPCGVSSIL